MKIGVKLHHSGPGATAEMMRRWTLLAETLGFHFVMAGDHVALTPDVTASYPAPFFEACTSLTWLAAQTRTIGLGTTVLVVPYHHPLHLAQLTTSVDVLSGGRLILGVGVGWARQEFEALGVPFEQRGAITDDYLAALKVLWTEQPASYEGRFVRFRDVTLDPRPVQRPHPPLWIGGDSDAALRRAVRFGDAWHPINVRLDWIRQTALPKLAAFAEEQGRPVPALCPRIRCRITESPLPEEGRFPGEGTLDQIRRDVEVLASLGATHVLLDTKGGQFNAASPHHHDEAWRTLSLLAEKVFDLENERVR
jgi:probable F420-dependent oxidoreductase